MTRAKKTELTLKIADELLSIHGNWIEVFEKAKRSDGTFVIRSEVKLPKEVNSKKAA